MAAFGRRIAPRAVLLHPVRAGLYGLATSQPGSILRDAFHISPYYGVLRHHARVLEAHGLITTRRVGPALAMFSSTNCSNATRILFHRRDPTGVRALELVRGLGQRRARRALAMELGLSRMGAWKAVRRALSLPAPALAARSP